MTLASSNLLLTVNHRVDSGRILLKMTSHTDTQNSRDFHLQEISDDYNCRYEKIELQRDPITNEVSK